MAQSREIDEARVTLFLQDGGTRMGPLATLGADGLRTLLDEGSTSFGVPRAFALTVSNSWFDGRRSCDRALVPHETLPPAMEIDSVAILRHVAALAPRSRWWDLLVYQHWRPMEADGSRLYQALMPDQAREVAAILGPLPVRRLLVVGTGFYEGSIRAFAETLAQGRRTLETLGLFWYFSGDDITDQAFDRRSGSRKAVETRPSPCPLT